MPRPSPRAPVSLSRRRFTGLFVRRGSVFQHVALNPCVSEIMGSTSVLCRSPVRMWLGVPLALHLAIGLSGCDTEALGTRLNKIKASLQSHGIEVHKGKVMRVFRF